MIIAARIRASAPVVVVAVAMIPWLTSGRTARADVVTDWNIKAGDIVSDARLPAPPCNRVLAIVQTTVFQAVNSITRRYPSDRVQIDVAAGASVDAAVAAANRATLVDLLPAQEAAIDAAYREALAKVADGSAKTAGIEAGNKAAAAVLASRAHDGADAAESYRPYSSAGVYVPTSIPLVTQWPHRQPWLMTSPSQFRPGPPLLGNRR